MLTQDQIEREKYFSRMMKLHDDATARGDREKTPLVANIRLCQRLLGQPEISEDNLFQMRLSELLPLSQKLEAELKDRVQRD